MSTLMTHVINWFMILFRITSLECGKGLAINNVDGLKQRIRNDFLLFFYLAGGAVIFFLDFAQASPPDHEWFVPKYFPHFFFQ